MGTYSGPPSAADGLVFYLDAANSASYSGSGNTFYNLVNASIGGSIVGYASTPIDNTQIKSLTFDGTNDFISVGSLGSFYTQGTISFWMKSLDITANYRNPFATNYNGSNTNVLRFEQGEGTGAFKCWFGDPSGTIASLSYSSISANTWYNVVLTWNQSTSTVTGYMNGVLDVNNSSWVRWPTSFVNVGIGLGYNSRYFKGFLGQISIYNRALSASEVYQNYNASKKRYFPEENIVTDGLVLHLDAANSSSYIGSGTSSNSLVGGIAGTLVNGTGFSAVGGGAFFFDGTNDYINLGNSSVLKPTVLSVGCYFKINTIGAVHVIVGKQGPGAGAASYALVVQSGKLHFRICNSSGTEYNASSDFSDTTNYNYALGTYDGSTLRLYLNGASIASSTVGISIGYSDSYPLKVGYYGDAIPVNMNVSVLNIYNRVLSATEVQQNYNALRGRYNI